MTMNINQIINNKTASLTRNLLQRVSVQRNKFILETHIVKELQNSADSKGTKALRTVLLEFCKQSPSVMVENPGTINLWNLITDENKLKDFITMQMENNGVNSNKLASLKLRIERFLKQITVIILLFGSAQNPIIKIEQKILDVAASLKKINIIIDPKIRPGLIITFESTIKMINNNLINNEKIIKECIVPLCLTFNNTSASESKASLASEHPELVQILESLAPIGFLGVEPDNYYIITLILRSHFRLRFNADQQKQLNTYLNEIEDVFKICLIEDKELALDFGRLLNSRTTINKTVKEFFGNEPMSDSTYTDFIKALNHFMRDIWNIALIRSVRNYKVKLNYAEPL